MKIKWKKLGMRLLFPHPLIVALLTLLSAAGLIYGFTALAETHALRIASYALSFYTLVLLCLRAPEMYTFGKRLYRENRFMLRYTGDVRLRMGISLFGSFAYNAVYALFQFLLGLYYRSAWFYAMAGYYALLALLRLMLGSYVHAHAPGEEKRSEWRKYRLCGAGLAGMNLALLVFVFYFMNQLRVVRHHEITVIAMAVYSFCAFSLAIANVVRYRRYESPVCSAAKALSLANATASMLSLEDVMLTTFSTQEHTLLRRIVLGLSGTATTLFILWMAIYMIVRASKNLSKEWSDTP